MKIDKAEWDALNGAVAIAEAAVMAGGFCGSQEQLNKLSDARNMLNQAEVKRLRAYLPSHHPQASK